MSIHFKTSCSLNYRGFIINLEPGKCEFTDLSFVSNCQCDSVFNTSLSLFTKQLAEISRRILLARQINLRTDILITLCLLVRNKKYISSELFFFHGFQECFLIFTLYFIYLNLKKKKKNKTVHPSLPAPSSCNHQSVLYIDELFYVLFCFV